MSKFNLNLRLERVQWQFSWMDRLACGLWRVTKEGARRIMRRRVKPRFWGFMIGITLIVFLASFAVMRIRYGYGAQRMEDAWREHEQLAAEADRLERQFKYAQSDEYVIRVARDELNMIMPGEIRYVNGAR